MNSTIRRRIWTLTAAAALLWGCAGGPAPEREAVPAQPLAPEVAAPAPQAPPAAQPKPPPRYESLGHRLGRELVDAARRGLPDRVRDLVAQGADLDVADEHGNTGLHYAAGWGDSTVNLLVSLGADVFATNANGETPLHRAAAEGRPGTIRILLGEGADINARDRNGRTPLMAAALADNRDAAQQLLDRGANPALRDHAGRTARDLAASPALASLLAGGN